MMNPVNFDLYQAVVNKLAGRPILLRFCDPYGRQSRAEAHVRDTDNTAVIDIRPGLSLEKTYQALLHEAAHVRLHSAYLMPSNVHRLPSGAGESIYAGKSELQVGILTSVETEADLRASEWTQKAEKIGGINSTDWNDVSIFRRLIIIKDYLDLEKG
jgi:hypothetical protein